MARAVSILTKGRSRPRRALVLLARRRRTRAAPVKRGALPLAAKVAGVAKGGEVPDRVARAAQTGGDLSRAAEGGEEAGLIHRLGHAHSSSGTNRALRGERGRAPLPRSSLRHPPSPSPSSPSPSSSSPQQQQRETQPKLGACSQPGAWRGAVRSSCSSTTPCPAPRSAEAGAAAARAAGGLAAAGAAKRRADRRAKALLESVTPTRVHGALRWSA